MSTSRQLRLVLVTPEKTLLDEPVRAIRVPLYDGEIGIFPGHAPLVGRLGYGKMVVETGGQQTQYFVDGGFLQVNGDTASVLTNRALPQKDVDSADAAEKLQEAVHRVTHTDVEDDARQRDQQRYRGMANFAKLPR
ncbi:ATP synthase F1 subunit epsilon [Calycomorphotria hydatis]|uniref:ATP synthase epsilon chain n=1 Tax=Calycomorphotria hydatis TaxID=2528027 RepID=A0A517T6G7_9PLAN|nr:ATP synthase F1 subunit epsilon [Calycomorphotria hydatis]QDT63973.1 ATP synthase epsilon chain [Calycomorphotria hydatis]